MRGDKSFNTAQEKTSTVQYIQLSKDNILDVYSIVDKPPILTTRAALDKWEEYEEIVMNKGMEVVLDEGITHKMLRLGGYLILKDSCIVEVLSKKEFNSKYDKVRR